MPQPQFTFPTTHRSFVTQVLGMSVGSRGHNKEELESCEEEPMNEFLDKVYDIRQAILPPSGDFVFSLEEDIDSIISEESPIVVKYSISEDSEESERNIQYYIVNAHNRYVTWRDVLHSLNCNSCNVGELTDHCFIEGLRKDTDIQYVLECGS